MDKPADSHNRPLNAIFLLCCNVLSESDLSHESPILPSPDSRDGRDRKKAERLTMNADKKETTALMFEADADDLRQARKIIGGAIEEASNLWIPKHLIAAALTLEFEDLVDDGLTTKTENLH